MQQQQLTSCGSSLPARTPFYYGYVVLGVTVLCGLAQG